MTDTATGQDGGIGGALREAGWLGRERAIAYSKLLIAASVVIAGLWIGAGRGLVDRNGKPFGSDFVSFWAAAELAREGAPEAAYEPARHERAEQQAVGSAAIPYFAFFYPPPFLLAVSGLALLSYGWALVLWLAATGAAYAAVIARMLRSREAAWAALGCPAALLNVLHGQNGFLSAALFGGGLMALERRPALAGALFGGLVYKPQLACLVPVALVAARQWRALAAAIASAAALAGASLAFFGVKTYAAFLANVPLARRTLEGGLVDWPKMQSAFAAIRLAGGSVAAAYAVQIALALGAAAAVAWAWRGNARSEAKAAVLVAASLLVSPFLLHYDLVVLAIPVACVVRFGAAGGFLPWEKLGLAAAWVLPLASMPVARLTSLQIAPLVCALVLSIAWRRLGVRACATPSPA